MARIGLTSGFSTIPEGHYVFQVTSVEYKEAFGKLTINLQTQDGQKQIERFGLLTSKGEPNDKAYNAFSFMAKKIMNDFEMTDVDPEDLVGHFIEADVEHTEVPSTKDPSKTSVFAHLRNLESSDGWMTASEEDDVLEEADGDVDLNELLNGL